MSLKRPIVYDSDFYVRLPEVLNWRTLPRGVYEDLAGLVEVQVVSRSKKKKKAKAKQDKGKTKNKGGSRRRR